MFYMGTYTKWFINRRYRLLEIFTMSTSSTNTRIKSSYIPGTLLKPPLWHRLYIFRMALSNVKRGSILLLQFTTICSTLQVVTLHKPTPHTNTHFVLSFSTWFQRSVWDAATAQKLCSRYSPTPLPHPVSKNSCRYITLQRQTDFAVNIDSIFTRRDTARVGLRLVEANSAPKVKHNDRTILALLALGSSLDFLLKLIQYVCPRLS